MNHVPYERLPRSARQVYKVLESNGVLTQKDVIEKTYLSPRTVRYALGRLRDERIILERFNFKDARQSLYGINRDRDDVISS